MNKLLFLLLVSAFVFSCNKVKHKNKQMSGDWELTSYSEIIFDGTKNRYTVGSGLLHFDNLNDQEPASFQLDFSAYSENDTVAYHLSGTYTRQTLDSVTLTTSTGTFPFYLERQFKTDMNFQGELASNRKSVFILKKK